MDKNLRSGYLAQQLGSFLLRPICAIADVPVMDDVGIDMIGTLLKQDGSRRMFPGRSLAIQIKSKSIDSIEYNRDQIHWLTACHLPVFWAQVDISAASIAMYTGHILSRFANNNCDPKATLFLVELDTKGANFGIKESDKGRVQIIRSGPPVVTWSIKDVMNAGMMARIVEILDFIIETELDNRAIRRHCAVTWLNWETNQMPTRHKWALHGTRLGGESLRKQLEEALPTIHGILLHSAHENMTDEDRSDLHAIVNYCVRNGIPENELAWQLDIIDNARTLWAE